MQIIDRTVSRDPQDSQWATVTFIGDGGEMVAVRLPCITTPDDALDNAETIRRASVLLLDAMSSTDSDTPGERRPEDVSATESLDQTTPPPSDQELNTDNCYQESDEALPDDREERTLTRDPSREGGRFDEV